MSLMPYTHWVWPCVGYPWRVTETPSGPNGVRGLCLCHGGCAAGVRMLQHRDCGRVVWQAEGETVGAFGAGGGCDCGLVWSRQGGRYLVLENLCEPSPGCYLWQRQEW